jgi:thiamine kinase-like enzyme
MKTQNTQRNGGSSPGLSEYLEGRHPSAEDFRNPALRKQSARLLRELHYSGLELPWRQGTFQRTENMRTHNLEVLKDPAYSFQPWHRSAVQEYLEVSGVILQEVRALRDWSHPAWRPTHNDPHSNNLILSPQNRLRLIDLQAVSMGPELVDVGFAAWTLSNGGDLKDSLTGMMRYYGIGQERRQEVEALLLVKLLRTTDFYIRENRDPPYTARLKEGINDLARGLGLFGSGSGGFRNK